MALLTLALTGCSTRANGFYYYEKKSFENYNMTALSEGNPEATVSDPSALLGDILTGRPAQNTGTSHEEAVYHKATVNVPLKNVYVTSLPTSRVVDVLAKGDEIEVAYYTDLFWMVKKRGVFLGYCESDGIYSGIWDNDYAYLPRESGMARDADGNMVAASSHLVDVLLDNDKFEFKMKLATEGTSIGKPFYTRNLCILQYDTLQKLITAAELFEKDGYTIVIYDAYRPTSVQQRWFDVIRVHKWVADPSVGMGGIHDRGTAVDMTLMDRNGVELDMPTAIHTLTEASSRYAAMTAVQKQNVNYMTNIMVQCGFDYIRSEWWHFQDTNTVNYLPTDHPIDEIPLVYMEGGQP